ncbi:MAG: glycosyltransferase family 2 protein [Spirochaetales bacterium]|nr:glycosyltransferase family 2 protein [Spirochaetales bacterium]
MNPTPRVSVIMGAYNCEATVGAAVESMLAQDFPDLELIVCDDGSTDGTFAELERLARMDSRVVVLRNERNSGLSATLNHCVSVARGEYLARMDGDDVSRPDRIGKQVAFLDAHPEFSFCGCSISLFDGSGVWGGIDYPERPEARDFLLRSPYAHPTVVFRSAALAAVGGYDADPAIGRSEDYDLFMRLHAAGLPGANLPEKLLEYREEIESYRKRKFRYALTEARVRWRGFKRLGLMPVGLLYVIKPIVVGLFPKHLYKNIRKAIFGGKRDA